MSSQPLFVFALRMETQGFFDIRDTLATGVGKVQAAYALTRRVSERRPSLIVNLGTAGSALLAPGTVVCCRRFVQRDMDVTGLGFPLGVTPFSDAPRILEYGLAIAGLPDAVCGSGDSFSMSAYDQSYDVVDMEAYALAYVAKREAVPFACLKYVSDGSDAGSAADWPRALETAAKALAKAVADHLDPVLG
jgi:adenosylhomocysteine nucleosidase